MERDIDEIKPRKWLVIILILIAIIITVVLANKIIIDKKENHSIFDIFNFATENMDKINNSFNKDTFNNDFEFYVGTKTGGSLSRLIDEIITNNKKNKEHILTVIYNDINTTDTEIIKNIKIGIKTFDKYEILIDYNEEGYVNIISIELIEKDTSELKGFNSYYEMYSGTERGISVKSLLDNVITNNKTNQDKILTVIYKDINTNDVETIKTLKNKIDDHTEYEVSLNYNDDGFVYEIVIG